MDSQLSRLIELRSLLLTNILSLETYLDRLILLINFYGKPRADFTISDGTRYIIFGNITAFNADTGHIYFFYDDEMYYATINMLDTVIEREINLLNELTEEWFQ